MSFDSCPVPPEGGPAERSDVSIPPARETETHELRDRLVSCPAGLLIVAPVAGVVLILRPETAEVVLGAVALALTALGTSRPRHQRRRWN